MKSNKLIFLVLIFTFINSLCFAQDKENALKIIEKVMKFYEREDFRIAVQYRLLTTEGNLVDSYDGIAIKNSHSLYARINNTEIIQENGITLKINSDEKAALITKSENGQFALTQNLKLIERYDDIYIEERRSEILITLIAPDITQLPYTNVKLVVAKDNFRILKQELDIIAKIPVDEGGITVMKNVSLIINFEEIKSNEYSKKSLNDFLTVQNKSYQLTGQYSNFELIDQTNI